MKNGHMKKALLVSQVMVKFMTCPEVRVEFSYGYYKAITCHNSEVPQNENAQDIPMRTCYQNAISTAKAYLYQQESWLEHRMF